jgi:hypothetical protein
MNGLGHSVREEGKNLRRLCLVAAGPLYTLPAFAEAATRRQV